KSVQHGACHVRRAAAPGFPPFRGVAAEHQGSHIAGAPARSRRKRAGCRVIRKSSWPHTKVRLDGDLLMNAAKRGSQSVKTITIQQVVTPIRGLTSQRARLGGLKLNRIGRVAQLPDTPATRGMLAKVSHLVRVIE